MLRHGNFMKIIALAMILGGFALGAFGLHAMSAASADMSRFLSEAPDRTPWILMLGIAVLGAGLATLFLAFRKADD